MKQCIVRDDGRCHTKPGDCPEWCKSTEKKTEATILGTTPGEVSLNLDDLKCLRMSEAADQFQFLNTLAVKHNELVAFLARHLVK